MFMLIANIGFGQGVKSIKFSYTKLKEIGALLGTKNSIAFYAVKDKGVTKLIYAIYDPATLEVNYYNGNPITDIDFKKLRENMKLDLTVKFSGKNHESYSGASGTIRKITDYGDEHFVMMALNIFNVQMIKKNVDPNTYFLNIYSEKNKIKWKISTKTGKIWRKGGGPGDTTVAKAP